MTAAVAVVTDSTAGLTTSLTSRYRIRVVPLRIVAGAAAAHDAAGIVSVHLSGSLSGTVNSALVAAGGAAVPVQVVDSRSLGLGLGFAVLDAAALAGGWSS